MNSKIFDELFMLNEQTWTQLAMQLLSEYDIGVLLRVHLLTEKALEAWCCAASDNPNFFDGFGEFLVIPYAAKLQLASNFGLNEFSCNELKELNHIRFTRSHQIDNAKLTDEEIKKMVTLISQGGQKQLIESDNFGVWVNGKGLYLNDPKVSNREKLIVILAGVVNRIAKQIHKNDDGFIAFIGDI